MKTLHLIFITLVFSVAQIKSQQPFIENSANANLIAHYGNGTYCGGLSFADFNNDGYDDITIATELGDSILFFKNNGDGTFIKLPSLTNSTSEQKSVLWVDLDNDGDLDFFHTSYLGQNRIYKNNFIPTAVLSLTDMTNSSGLIIANETGFGATFGDYNKDGFLDVFISNFSNTEPFPSRLYRNNGNFSFTNVSTISGISSLPRPTFCAAFFDFDNDCNQDIYTIVDRYVYPNMLYKNNGNNTFTESGSVYGANVSIGAMNAGVVDYNYDTWSDIYVTNEFQSGQSTPYNLLMHNNGSQGAVYFFDQSSSTQLDIEEVNWGAAFFDADNDKDLDVYICSEHSGHPSWHNKLMLHNGNMISPSFTEFPSGGLSGDTLNSFACGVGDFNNDGKQDIAVVNNNYEDVKIWENQFNTNNKFVKFKLQGTTSNRMGIGTKIQLFTGSDFQTRTTHCGINYLAQNSLTEHFGLGSASTIDSIKILWPSGNIDSYKNLGNNSTFSFIESGCLNHSYENDFNSAANYFTGTNGVMNQASNWSKGHVPTLDEDAILSTTSILNLTNNNTLSMRSLVLKGPINLTNNGTINCINAYGTGLKINAASSLVNNVGAMVTVLNSCGTAVEMQGNFTNHGMVNFENN
jgi:hypothetical protein